MLALVVLSLTSVACAKEAPVIGRWSMVYFTLDIDDFAPESNGTKGAYIYFEKGNKGFLNIAGDEYQFDWTENRDLYKIKFRYESETYELPVSIRGDALRIYNLPMLDKAMATFVLNPEAHPLPSDIRMDYIPGGLNTELPESVVHAMRAEADALSEKRFVVTHIYSSGRLNEEAEERFSIYFEGDGTGRLMNTEKNDEMEWKINTSGKVEIFLPTDDTILEGGFLGDTLVLYVRGDLTFALLLSDNPDQHVLPKEFENFTIDFGNSTRYPSDTQPTSQQSTSRSGNQPTTQASAQSGSQAAGTTNRQSSHLTGSESGGNQAGGSDVPQNDSYLLYEGWVRVIDQSSAYSDYAGSFVDCYAVLEEVEEDHFMFSVYEGFYGDGHYEPVLARNILRMKVHIDFETKQLFMAPADKSKNEINYLFDTDLDTYGEPFVINIEEDGKIRFKKLFVDADKDYIELEFFMREEDTPWQPGDVLPPSMQ